MLKVRFGCSLRKLRELCHLRAHGHDQIGHLVLTTHIVLRRKERHLDLLTRLEPGAVKKGDYVGRGSGPCQSKLLLDGNRLQILIVADGMH